jgi:carboxymethylenebutenolidase
MLATRVDIRAIGTLGFCMGGRLVGELAASGAALDAGVIYYGAPPPLDRVPNIRCPLEGHYASRDTPITSKVPAFAAAMKAAGKSFEYFVYEADHGFSLSPETHAHDAEATRVSMARTMRFLGTHLQPAAA